MRRSNTVIRVCSILLLGVAAMPAAAAAEEVRVDRSALAELQALRDRAAIHDLLQAYGRTIDERDFDAFGALFTDDGEYAGSKGPEAIAASMRDTFAANPLGFREPNFHVFFNETIEVDGMEATAHSMSFYVVPEDEGGYRIALMAAYDDELVKAGGEWKFRRRIVKGLAPAQPQ